MLTNNIVDFIKMPFYESFHVGVLARRLVPVSCPVSAAVKVPTHWKELVKEVLLELCLFLLSDILALLQGFRGSYLRATLLEEVFQDFKL